MTGKIILKNERAFGLFPCTKESLLLGQCWRKGVYYKQGGGVDECVGEGENKMSKSKEKKVHLHQSIGLLPWRSIGAV